MLESLSAWSLRLLAFSVFAFLWRRLTPETRVAPALRRVLSCCLLLLAFSPLFTTALPSISAWELPSASPAGTDGTRFLPEVESAVTSLCEPVIRSYTDAPYEIGVDANIRDDGSIDITVVEVLIGGEGPYETALTGELIDLLGPAVRVAFSGPR